MGEHEGIEGYLLGGFGVGGGGRTWVAHGSSNSPAMAAALRRAPVRDGDGGRVRELLWVEGKLFLGSVGGGVARGGLATSSSGHGVWPRQLSRVSASTLANARK